MKEELFHVAMYLRLSREDKDIGGGEENCSKSESNSIGSQREMIRTYIQEQKNMQLYDIYVDDGFTGSNFDRPEFKRMICDVEAGRVNCIIVKDLSRFGRDYIEAGRFIQKTFPALSVRFIAITDHYDSLYAEGSESSIVLPVKNFINDAYCRDISTKVKSQLEVKRKNGEFTGAFAVYGYLKDLENKHHLVVDEYAAECVKNIFAWKIEGMTAFAIAKKLNDMGFLSPMNYKKSLGMKFRTGFHTNSQSGWTSVSIKRILSNEVYLGHLVQGKKEKVNYKVKKIIEKAESDWVRVEHTHEPIISEDDFDTVQNLLKADGRKSSNTAASNPFVGLLFCGDCREQMVRRMNRYSNKVSIRYICSTKNRGEGCSRHSMEETILLDIVTLSLKKYVNAYMNQSNLLQQARGLETNFEVIMKYGKEIERLKKEQNKYYSLCAGLSEDLQNGIITKSEWKRLQSCYSHKSEELELSLQKQEDYIKELLERKISSGAHLKEFQRTLRLEQIGRYTIASLVKKIYVYEGHKVEIEFNFMDEFKIRTNKNQVIEYSYTKK